MDHGLNYMEKCETYQILAELSQQLSTKRVIKEFTSQHLIVVVPPPCIGLHYNQLCESGPVGAVGRTYGTRLCSITTVIFRAGEFKAAQIVIPEAKG